MSQPLTLENFLLSLQDDAPLISWSQPLQALWWDANGFWDKAHDLVDGYEHPASDVVHAYLHRKEGDEWNATYWYHRAQKPFFEGSLEEEWQYLVRLLLAAT